MNITKKKKKKKKKKTEIYLKIILNKIIKKHPKIKKV